MTQNEPEFVAADGTIRKQHYGSGRQPWDDIVDLGWGPIFAAGNVLKYVRRAAAKNGEDDIAKARWYYSELVRMAQGINGGCPQVDYAKQFYAELVQGQLLSNLTEAEISLVAAPPREEL